MSGPDEKFCEEALNAEKVALQQKVNQLRAKLRVADKRQCENCGSSPHEWTCGRCFDD